jgi:hypothetical protein
MMLSYIRDTELECTESQDLLFEPRGEATRSDVVANHRVNHSRDSAG